MTAVSPMFSCARCGAQFVKWVGRCLECGAWGSLEETAQEAVSVAGPDKKTGTPKPTRTLAEIAGADIKRRDTGIQELNRVLGGGIVPGSLILLGGEPGIGKSTLALQLAASSVSALYISGEENIAQIKLRADRLSISAPALKLANIGNIHEITATIAHEKPALAVIDSVQTVASADMAGAAGTVNQIRACTAEILTTAKTTGTAVVLIGHVTKDGAVAGPKTLEHLVDTVLYFEGERHHTRRILRTVKNRFGPTDEVGLFDMRENGLVSVSNPSAELMEDGTAPAPGSILTCLMEGTRPMLIEIQALVNKTAFGYPARKTSGFDINRLHVLAAVLEKMAGLALSQYDIHINIVGGLTADEPAADLAVCMAIASSYKNKTIGRDTAVWGEVGLAGEIRPVAANERRIKECGALGISRIFLPATKNAPASRARLVPVRTLAELETVEK